VLPRPHPSEEDPQYRDSHSLDDLRISSEAALEVSEYSLLRCALEGLAVREEKATKEELFAMLEERYSWLKTEEGIEYQSSLWDTLSKNPSFEEVDDGGRSVWVFRQPEPSEAREIPLMASLSSLRSSLPPSRSQTNPFQHSLQALTDLTGYITMQTYNLTSSSLHMPTMGISAPLGPQEEEIRREIRALKGLVLNRRTFAPPTSRANSSSIVADNMTV